MGGASEGLRRAGFHVAVAVDIDPWALKSHAGNHGVRTRHILADVRTVDFAALNVQYGPFDYVHFSSPCQDVSTQTEPSARDLKRGLELLDAAIRAVDVIKPSLGWSLENVPGMAPHLEERGLKPVVLNAADYGVPQTRRRVFAGNFTVPKPTTPQWLGWADAIGYPGMKGSAWLERGHGNGTLPLDVDQPAPTVTGKGLIWVVNDDGSRFQIGLEHRLAFQGWSGARVFGPARAREQQIGNLVPPPLMEAVARATKRRPPVTASTEVAVHA